VVLFFIDEIACLVYAINVFEYFVDIRNYDQFSKKQ
jgi:hypothetical protein